MVSESLTSEELVAKLQIWTGCGLHKWTGPFIHTVKMVSVCFSETSLICYRTIWLYIPVTAAETSNPTFNWCFEHLISWKLSVLHNNITCLMRQECMAAQLWFAKPSWLLHPLFCAALWSKARQGKIGLLRAWFCYTVWKSVVALGAFPLAKCVRPLHSLVLLLKQSVCWFMFFFSSY